MSLNVVHLVGHAGQDPEIKYFESGKVLCTLNLAVKRISSKTDGPDWFKLNIWGKTAEIAKNYVRKGSLIGVSGSLRIESWADRGTGANRTSPVIQVDKLDLLGSKKDIDPNAVGSSVE